MLYRSQEKKPAPPAFSILVSFAGRQSVCLVTALCTIRLHICYESSEYHLYSQVLFKPRQLKFEHKIQTKNLKQRPS